MRTPKLNNNKVLDMQASIYETASMNTNNSVIEMVDKLVTDGGYTLYPDRNVIRDPGKFEGEHVMTLYFYDAYLNGDGDQYGDDNDLSFNVSDDEAAAFSIVKGSQVILKFSDQGFVTSYINS